MYTVLLMPSKFTFKKAAKQHVKFPNKRTILRTVNPKSKKCRVRLEENEVYIAMGVGSLSVAPSAVCAVVELFVMLRVTGAA